MKEMTNGRQVLVVDDDPALLKLVSAWLTAGGFTVVACDSFEDARRGSLAPAGCATDRSAARRVQRGCSSSFWRRAEAAAADCRHVGI